MPSEAERDANDELWGRCIVYGEGLPRHGSQIDVDILEAQMIVAGESGEISIQSGGEFWDVRR